MKIKDLSYWLISGVVIFPVLIVLGLFFGLASGGKISALYWMVIPSIIFEETFETCCQTFSDNLIFNLLFIGIFWFGIGSLTGWLTEKLKNTFNP
jgi:ABC-type transporter Mla maintaining outer membrane lipid asymmetry permease subunit MlaE